MTGFVHLTKAVARKGVMLRYRYLLNTVGNFAMLYVLFLLIFFGGQRFSVQAVTESLEGIIVGVFLFATAQIVFSRIAFDITNEAQWGTLEQLYLTPFRFETVLLLKSAVNVIVSFFFGVVLLGLMMVTSSTFLSLDPITTGVLGLLTLLPVVGLGFMTGSLAILYKRVENVFNLMQFAFIICLTAPVDQNVFLRLLPLSYGNHLLGIVLQENLRLWEIPVWDLSFLIVHALAYLLLGACCVRVSSKLARRRGALSHYG